ncbi:MAG: cysteine desulfurase NifS [Candidatus Aegiribacteria sp. MLS_C]|nr:MAG: cysteine desulfurase NifS [Candidatus Aegiribacteria sp. MLS_C]
MKAYLDNNATTRMAPEVLEAMMPFLTGKYGNPSSFHSFGSEVMDAVERARESVAALIGAERDEIFFTSGGTESDNTALRGACAINPLRPGLVVTDVEHPAVLRTAEMMESEGTPVRFAPSLKDGSLDLDTLFGMITEEVGLVSVMTANNETGAVYPVREIAEVARSRGVLVHTDAVQAAGKIVIDVGDTGVDLLSLSAHKFHGPKGVGVLFVRRGLQLPPLITGGHQEGGMRAGTYNAAGIAGMGKAAELAQEHLSGGPEHMMELSSRLERGILDSCPGSRVVAADVSRLPNTVTVLFRGVESEAVMTLLDMEGICVSSGSACSTGESSPSHVLTAMGIGPRDAGTAIRFSLSRYTAGSEVDCLLEVLPGMIDKLRKISPYAD